MKQVQILGTGCPKCEKLAKTTAEAAELAGIDCEIEKVTDIQKIMQYGVMMTPALVIDGKVKVVGKVPPVEEIKEMLLK